MAINNKWFILGGLILLSFIIFYRYINITLYNSYMNKNNVDITYAYDNDNVNNIK